jgi:hypothetical protein
MAECFVPFASLFDLKYGRPHAFFDVWRCSVDIDHPEFLERFAAEDAAPVSDEQAAAGAQEAVAQAIREIEDVVLPYLVERVEWEQRAGGGATQSRRR